MDGGATTNEAGGAGTTGAASSRGRKPRTVTARLGLISGSITVGGLVVFAFYAFSVPGPAARYLGVGLLTAFAALATGCLFGFLFGVPKVVSSGEYRLNKAPPAAEIEANEDPLLEQTPGKGGSQTSASSADGAITRFTPSTNLSEVSDWLTKLLLGAGLVQLTHLGAPASALIGSVAAGLVDESGSPSGAAQVTAGAILIAYTVLGFLNGYVVTTLWYARMLPGT